MSDERESITAFNLQLWELSFSHFSNNKWLDLSYFIRRNKQLIIS